MAAARAGAVTAVDGYDSPPRWLQLTFGFVADTIAIMTVPVIMLMTLIALLVQSDDRRIGGTFSECLSRSGLMILSLLALLVACTAATLIYLVEPEDQAKIHIGATVAALVFLKIFGFKILGDTGWTFAFFASVTGRHNHGYAVPERRSGAVASVPHRRLDRKARRRRHRVQRLVLSAWLEPVQRLLELAR